MKKHEKRMIFIKFKILAKFNYINFNLKYAIHVIDMMKEVHWAIIDTPNITVHEMNQCNVVH